MQTATTVVGLNVWKCQFNTLSAEIKYHHYGDISGSNKCRVPSVVDAWR